MTESSIFREGGKMSDLEVRIVRLEPMRVARAHGFGPSPEEQATKEMMAFMAAKGLAFEAVRWFGFNNPGPSPASPNYGYDVWISVAPNVEGEGEGEIIEFEGGLYAVTRFKDLSNIGKMWQQLVLWREDSRYQPGPHQWLENLLVPPDTPYEEYVFDLYLPIAK
jgi:AraC family transcriptional regulator